MRSQKNDSVGRRLSSVDRKLDQLDGSLKEHVSTQTKKSSRSQLLFNVAIATATILLGLVTVWQANALADASGALTREIESNTRPTLELEMVAWYQLTWQPDETTLDSDVQPGGTPVALLSAVNTGRFPLTIGEIRQVDAGNNGADRTVVTTGNFVLRNGVENPFSSSAERDEQMFDLPNDPLFRIDAGEVVLLVVPIAESDTVGTDVREIQVSTLGKHKETFTQPFDNDLDEAELPTPGASKMDCASHDKALCRWGITSFQGILERIDTDSLICAPKFEIKDELNPTDKDYCGAWYVKQGWVF
ncbi:hypothetical protein [Lysinibacter cavernae]|uniref:Uncharacterized protein n=1 Tax=Lysinibacter cavernae TaxID=1640652 RepID=A0A7X5TVH8_9MICO|nr:hypothetical protein [Lysinibacter cavernae]NIH55342.1 hypothetical protein [Lysinibacter cavernae]